jgi:hypothetical protein
VLKPGLCKETAESSAPKNQIDLDKMLKIHSNKMRKYFIETCCGFVLATSNLCWTAGQFDLMVETSILVWYVASVLVFRKPGNKHIQKANKNVQFVNLGSVKPPNPQPKPGFIFNKVLDQ